MEYDKRVYCGLDLSITNSGIAVLNNDKMIHHEVVTNAKQFAKVHELVRINIISDKVVEYVSKYSPDVTMIEDYFVGKNAGSVIDLCQLGTMVRYKMLLKKYGFITCAPNQLKKFCLGGGQGKKELILKGVYKKWNVDVSNNNLADATVLAYMACAYDHCQNNDMSNMLGYEKEVITKIMKSRVFLKTL